MNWNQDDDLLGLTCISSPDSLNTNRFHSQIPAFLQFQTLRSSIQFCLPFLYQVNNFLHVESTRKLWSWHFSALLFSAENQWIRESTLFKIDSLAPSKFSNNFNHRILPILMVLHFSQDTEQRNTFLMKHRFHQQAIIVYFGFVTCKISQLSFNRPSVATR